MDQLVARVDERRFGMRYVVLDDLKPELLDRFKDPEAELQFAPYMKKIFGENYTTADILRPLLPHETNMKCLNSITYDPPQQKVRKSHFFTSAERSKSFNHHRNVPGGGQQKEVIPCPKLDVT